MGSVSILAALVRFICLKLVQATPRASITHTIDVWALVEIVSSILAVCLPSLRSFARKHGFGVEAGGKSSSASASGGSVRRLNPSIERTDSDKSGMRAGAGEMWDERDLEMALMSYLMSMLPGTACGQSVTSSYEFLFAFLFSFLADPTWSVMMAYSMAYLVGWSFGSCHLCMETTAPLIHCRLAQELEWIGLSGMARSLP
jgi:hypothetical protein